MNPWNSRNRTRKLQLAQKATVRPSPADSENGSSFLLVYTIKRTMPILFEFLQELLRISERGGPYQTKPRAQTTTAIVYISGAPPEFATNSQSARPLLSLYYISALCAKTSEWLRSQRCTWLLYRRTRKSGPFLFLSLSYLEC